MKRMVFVVTGTVLALGACSGGGDKTPSTATDVTQFPALTNSTTLDVSTGDTVVGVDSSGVTNPTLAPGITTVAPGSAVTAEPPPTTVNPAGAAVDSGNTYKVQSGDTLSGIAARLGVTRADLMALNAITDPNKVFAGQSLKVPTQRPTTTTTKSTATTKAGSTSGSGTTYTVKAGDTLGKIASTLGVKQAALAAANNITDPDKIFEGQKLIVPAAGATTTTKAGTATTKATATTTGASTASTGSSAATTATTAATTTTPGP